MEYSSLKKIRFSTMQLLAMGFIATIFLGGILLTLPISNTPADWFYRCAFYGNKRSLCNRTCNSCAGGTVYGIWKSHSFDFDSNRWTGCNRVCDWFFYYLKKKNHSAGAGDYSGEL